MTTNNTQIMQNVLLVVLKELGDNGRLHAHRLHAVHQRGQHKLALQRRITRVLDEQSQRKVALRFFHCIDR